MCDDRFTSLDGLYEHMEEEHDEDIPQDMSIPQYHYFLKTGKTHGNCIVCKNKTDWNEATNKYKRFCNNPKCTAKYREDFKKRMINKYGKTTLLNDPEQQRKMLAHRHISGEYIWSDGTKKTYTGSYELDFLKFLDVFMNFDSDDVFSPSPHTYYYEYNGEKKFYIPDIWIASLNLEIEIKESDNTHPHMQVDREKEQLKDSLMVSFKNIDYIKIIDKKYDTFFKYLSNKKEQYILTNSEYKMNRQKLTESYIDEGLDKNVDDIIEENFKPIIINNESSVILAKDILDDIINIAPEELDSKKLKLISESKKCYSNIKNYIDEKHITYKNGNYYSAAMEILDGNFNDIIGKDLAYNNLIPYNKSDESMISYIETRISELEKIKNLLSQILLLNLNLFGINIIEAQEKVINLPDDDKIKLLKKCINDKKYKDLFIKESKNTIIYDYSQLGGGQVLISKGLYNDDDFKPYLKITTPSQYLTRAFIYDVIIISHHYTVTMSNINKIPIMPVDVNGIKCETVYDAIINTENYKNKKFLILVCNPDNIELKKIHDLFDVDIVYGYIEKDQSNKHIRYSTLFEDYKISNSDNQYIIRWYDIIKSIIYIKNFIEKYLLTSIDNITMTLNPDEIEYFDIDDMSIHTYSINSIKKFYYKWYHIFDNISHSCGNIVLAEKSVLMTCQRILNKSVIQRNKGFMIGYSRVVNEGSCKLLVLGPRYINDYMYETVKEAIYDLTYMINNNLLNTHRVFNTGKYEMFKIPCTNSEYHRTFTLENADEVLKDWCNE